MPGLGSNFLGWGLAMFIGIQLSSPQPGSGAGGSEIKLPPLRVQAGEKAPDFALPSADDRTVRLSDFSGHNVLIDFYRGYW